MKIFSENLYPIMFCCNPKKKNLQLEIILLILMI
jgi:hypothetical protein